MKRFKRSIKAVLLAAALVIGIGTAVSSTSVVPAGAAAFECHATRTAPNGYNGQGLWADGYCIYGYAPANFYTWAQCFDGYGGMYYRYGAPHIAGSGLHSVAKCDTSYGSQLNVFGIYHD